MITLNSGINGQAGMKEQIRINTLKNKMGGESEITMGKLENIKV